MPTASEAARLQSPVVTSVFDVTRTHHTEDGLLDVIRFVIRTDMAAFSYRFPVPDGSVTAASARACHCDHRQRYR